MNKQITFILTLKISTSDFAQFLESVKRLVDETSREKGAVTYEYYVADDDRTIVIYERYVDADAAILHITNTFPPYAEEFSKLATTESFFIQGGITDQLRITMQGTQACYLTPLAGFDKA